MDGHSKISELLSHYGIGDDLKKIESLGAAGGFSGAEFWRAETGSGSWCLRKWPRQHPAEDRLRFMHRVLQHAWQQGFRRLPLPLQDQTGASFTQRNGHYWEITPWLSGNAISRLPAPAEQLAEAMQALAEFHQAVASFADSPSGLQRSPGMVDRHRLLQEMIDTGLQQIGRQLATCPHGELVDRAAVILDWSRRQAPLLLKKLEQHVGVKRRLQPCIRDIHHQHVLFHQSRVSGIIDFGAMNYDTVSTDVARLLGSLALNDLSCYQQGLAAYQNCRPLDAAEQACLETFDQANRLLSPLNWLQWLLVEKRQFDDWSLVWQRLDELIVRLV